LTKMKKLDLGRVIGRIEKRGNKRITCGVSRGGNQQHIGVKAKKHTEKGEKRGKYKMGQAKRGLEKSNLPSAKEQKRKPFSGRGNGEKGRERTVTIKAHKNWMENNVLAATKKRKLHRVEGAVAKASRGAEWGEGSKSPSRKA